MGFNSHRRKSSSRGDGVTNPPTPRRAERPSTAERRRCQMCISFPSSPSDRTSNRDEGQLARLRECSLQPGFQPSRARPRRRPRPTFVSQHQHRVGRPRCNECAPRIRGSGGASDRSPEPHYLAPTSPKHPRPARRPSLLSSLVPSSPPIPSTEHRTEPSIRGRQRRWQRARCPDWPACQRRSRLASAPLNRCSSCPPQPARTAVATTATIPRRAPATVMTHHSRRSLGPPALGGRSRTPALTGAAGLGPLSNEIGPPATVGVCEIPGWCLP